MYFPLRPVLIGCLLFQALLPAQTISLERAVNEALQNNPALQKAAFTAKAARAAVWSGIPENPVLFSEWEGPADGGLIPARNEHKTGLVQHIEFPLTYLYRLQGRSYAAGSAAARERAARNYTVKLVKKRYFAMLLMEKRTQLYEETYDLSLDNYEKARIRVLSGEAPPYDTLKIRVDLSEARNRLLAAQEHSRLAGQALAEVLGRSRGDDLRPAGELAFRPVRVHADSLEQLMLASHPELRAASLDSRRSKAGSREAWSLLLPSFSLKMFRHEFPRAAAGRGLEIGLRVPLWFLVNDRSRIRSADYAARAAESGVRAETQSLLLHLRSTLTDLYTAKNQTANYRDNTVKQVQELVRIASRSYEAGEMGYLELADAMRTMNRVLDAYYESIYTYMTAQAELEEAAGADLFDYFGRNVHE